MMSHPPIPISELGEHTELLKANDNLRLSQEYEVTDERGGPIENRKRERLCVREKENEKKEQIKTRYKT